MSCLKGKSDVKKNKAKYEHGLTPGSFEFGEQGEIDSAYCHTNHFMELHDVAQKITPTSAARLKRGCEYIQSGRPLGKDDVIAFISDTQDPLYPVYRDCTPPDDRVTLMTAKQRIDSVHIQSNIRRLGRIGIFSEAIHKFLVNLKRHHEGLFKSVDPGIVDTYLSANALGCFSRVKPTESRKTLVQLSNSQQ